MMRNMDEYPLISIILPVYNGEKYLTQAINSVLTQSYPNWELFIIDDGSSDSTPAICDEFAEKDHRIIVFHKPNGGVNAARATGVDNASGKYLTFLDADDTLSSDALDTMLNGFSDQVDVVYCGNRDGMLTQEEYIFALWGSKIKPGIISRLFRSSLFKEINYHLERRLVMGEDLLLNSLYALVIKRARLIAKDCYLINSTNEESVTKKFKHNWEYEKYYFSKVEGLFLNKSISLDAYDQIRLLVNKCWLNAMKYVMLDGNTVDYQDKAFIDVQAYFRDKKAQLGPSEKLIFLVKNPRFYRFILKTYMKFFA